MATPTKQQTWIVSPLVDLSCISVGWLVFFVMPLLTPEQSSKIRTVAFTFFVAHRYFTFLLVYLDRTEFARRKLIYALTPGICIVFVWLCYYFKVEEPEMFAFWWLFNYFHFVRQKYGILRIYSGKSRWGHKRMDEWTTYGWGLAGIFYMFAYQAEVEGRLMHYLATLFGHRTPPLEVAQGLFVIVALLTIAWLVHELRSPAGVGWPKMLFLGSVVLMYGVGPALSAEAVLIATSFSHASEYIALVGLTVKNKAVASRLDSPILNRASEHIVLYTVALIAGVSVILYGMKQVSMFTYLVFTYGTSFAHFIFDGMIWKLRRPKVAREVGTATA